jgi:triacylglycerol lipase
MTTINPPANSKFDARRAMELANLIERAYQQFQHFKKESKILWDSDSNKPNKPNELIGSTTRDDDLDDPNNPGREKYEVLAVFKVVEFTLTSSELVPFGFIAQRKLEDGSMGIFIVFRGTLTTDEWYHNSRVKQEDLFEDPTLGQISEGFNTVYTRSVDENYIKNIISEKIEDIFGDDGKPHYIGEKSIEYTVKQVLDKKWQIFITGHSLGGALATLATLHISTRYPQVKTILYTYASPRVGDPVFASNFKDLECYRIANSEDLVVSVPSSTGSLFGPDMNKEVSTKGLEEFTSEFKKDSKNFVYEHIGEPIYFTNQRGFVSTNHSMFYTYRAALPDPT